MPDTDTLTFKRGEDPIFSLDFKEEDEETPLDITGFTLYAEVWVRGSLRTTLTVANGGVIVTSPTEGQGSLVFTEAMTEGLPQGKVAFIKVFLISPADETLIFGPIYLRLSL